VITSDTPETDACWDSTSCNLLHHAQKLERERDEAREVASGLAMQEERVNEAQKELSSIHRWIERNHPDGFIDSLTYFQNLERVTDNWYDRLDRLEVDAKRFERERDEARHKLELCMAANSDVARIAKERDEARELHRKALSEREATEKEVDAMLERSLKAERERDEAREAFVIATDQMVIAQGKVREANKERDEAREQVDRYRDKLDLLPISWEL